MRLLSVHEGFRNVTSQNWHQPPGVCWQKLGIGPTVLTFGGSVMCQLYGATELPAHTVHGVLQRQGLDSVFRVGILQKVEIYRTKVVL